MEKDTNTSGRVNKRRPNKRKRRAGKREREKKFRNKILYEIREQLRLAEENRISSHPEGPCYSPPSQASTIVISDDEETPEIPTIDTDTAVKINNHYEFPTELLVRYIQDYKKYMQNVE
ncbi:uncharacterized protein LOC113465181 [Ceratina calcarata]|uniref:Uncharacterized protein LOC113464946 n=1 Tax=Ceratina calcarata TaxID=156304 RepID=A0AAJ7S8Q2_9HYME|nr:uncharacterized protein LOC113464946 [Ceratina calcarata]XP_026675095.1 uncharacterized protein LOC113465181 [Ceratina calcarata]